jgi:hypothetical protein
VKLLKARRAMTGLLFAHGVVVVTSGGTRDDPRRVASRSCTRFGPDVRALSLVGCNNGSVAGATNSKRSPCFSLVALWRVVVWRPNGVVVV